MKFSHVVGSDLAGQRLDVAVARLEPELSRAQVQRLIEQGEISVPGAVAKPAHKLRLGERICGRVPEPAPAHLEPQAIALDIVFAVYMPPHEPLPGHARRSISAKSVSFMRPAPCAPTASKTPSSCRG